MIRAVASAAVWLPVGLVVGQAGGLGLLTALGLAGLAILVFTWLLTRLSATPDPKPSPGVSARRARAVFVRFRDPDTPGRPRPRAPSGSPALA
jgi:hypothetical protein